MATGDWNSLTTARWGNPSTGGQNAYGLDLSNISTVSTQGQSVGNQTNYLGQNIGASGGSGPNTSRTTYNGPGGQWTQQNGAWVNGTGQQVSDLPGYLKMRQNQQQGANFTGYQNQLNDQLKQQSQANSQYQNLLKDPNAVQNTAGYQFAVNQGNQAINRSAAAKGMLNSGNVLAELAKYGQGMGSQLYQQELGNQQQNFQNQNTQTNNLADLMRSSQQFGIGSGYYQSPQNLDLPYGGQRNNPSTW